MKATIKLEDPEFVGDYIRQQIDEFIKKYPEVNDNLIYEFMQPIQLGIERILCENRTYKDALRTLRNLEC